MEMEGEAARRPDKWRVGITRRERGCDGGCTWAEKVPGSCPRQMLTVEKGMGL